VSLIAVVALVLATAAPVPSGYEGAVGALPPGHWALVSRVDLIDEHDGHTYGDRRIEIPRKPDADILTHEVGHVVAIAHPELEAAYLARFERRGDSHERWAEAYSAAVRGSGGRRGENAWFRDNVLVALDPPERPDAAPMPTLPPVELCDGDDGSGAIVHGCTNVPSSSVR
jgi:hypothetical protein